MIIKGGRKETVRGGVEIWDLGLLLLMPDLLEAY